ncbi:Hypothetical predicted protein [Olea europaea subsp. europaea]|uniref:Uncharacterized protein n=1 Tax=Olea europaea subsp. europaea TaxID=158383 RepID=A0A8S0PNN3_OLEEU|nr:Hypothetical predicted protein [Olea europaea subsp. europaea]
MALRVWFPRRLYSDRKYRNSILMLPVGRSMSYSSKSFLILEMIVQRQEVSKLRLYITASDYCRRGCYRLRRHFRGILQSPTEVIELASTSYRTILQPPDFYAGCGESKHWFNLTVHIISRKFNQIQIREDSKKEDSVEFVPLQTEVNRCSGCRRMQVRLLELLPEALLSDVVEVSANLICEDRRGSGNPHFVTHLSWFSCSTLMIIPESGDGW